MCSTRPLGLLRVKLRSLSAQLGSPLCPQQRASSARPVGSEKCHTPTWLPQARPNDCIGLQLHFTKIKVSGSQPADVLPAGPRGLKPSASPPQSSGVLPPGPPP